jgi:hypothetical protein
MEEREMEIIVKDSEGKETVCQDARSAARLAKKIEKEEQKREAEHKRKREMAYIYAGNAIARLLYAIDNHTRWTFETNHHNVKSHHFGDSAKYETEQGTVETDHAGYRVSGFMSDSAGFDIAVRLADKDRNETIWWALGIFEGRISFREIPVSLETRIDQWLSIQ